MFCRLGKDIYSKTEKRKHKSKRQGLLWKNKVQKNVYVLKESYL